MLCLPQREALRDGDGRLVQECGRPELSFGRRGQGQPHLSQPKRRPWEVFVRPALPWGRVGGTGKEEGHADLKFGRAREAEQKEEDTLQPL